MKRYLLPTLVLLPLFTISQAYHPLVVEHKVWSEFHNYCKGDDVPFTRYLKFEGEVMVNDTVYKQLWASKDTLLEPWAVMELIREDSQKRVWERSSGAWPEYLKYDFGAQPGDTLWLTQNPESYVMGDIDSVQLLSGEYRKQYHLLYPVWPDCEETWIEGVGCLKGLLWSGMCGAVGDDPNLICYLSNDTVLYHNQLFSECHVITVIEESSSTAFSLRAFPNPATGSVTIELPLTHSEGTLVMDDILGRMTVNLSVHPGVTPVTLDLNDLPEGLYFLYFEATGASTPAVKVFKRL